MPDFLQAYLWDQGMHKTSWSNMLLSFLLRLDQQGFEKGTAMVLAWRGMTSQRRCEKTEIWGH